MLNFMLLQSDSTQKTTREFAGVYDTFIHKIVSWYHTLIGALPRIVGAIIIVLLFIFVARLVQKLVRKLLLQATHNKTIIDLLENIVGAIIIGVGVFVALGILELSSTVKSLLAGAGIIGLALGFAFQDIAANFISGIFLSVRHPFGKGDIIESQDHYGIVQKVNLRCTLIKTPQGQIVYLPNKDVYGKYLINYTKNHERRIDLDIGVSYADDHEKAKKLAIEAVENLDTIDKDRDVELFYTGIGGSTFNYTIRFWVNFRKNQDYLAARSDAIVAIGRTYEENDIDMSYPIRTLDFGVKGGVKLDDMLQGLAANGDGAAKEGKEDKGDKEENEDQESK